VTGFERLFYASGPFKWRYVLDKDTISNIVVVAQLGHIGSLCTGDIVNFREKERGGMEQSGERERKR